MDRGKGSAAARRHDDPVGHAAQVFDKLVGDRLGALTLGGIARPRRRDVMEPDLADRAVQQIERVVDGPRNPEDPGPVRRDRQEPPFGDSSPTRTVQRMPARAE